MSRLPPDWRAYLRAGLKESERDLLRQHELTGRPLGAEDFIEALETRLRRPLKNRRPGSKRDGKKGITRKPERKAARQR